MTSPASMPIRPVFLLLRQGLIFSLPVASKLLLGTKFQAGYSYLVKNEVEMDLQEKAPHTEP